MSKICYTVGSYWNTWKMLESICASRLWFFQGATNTVTDLTLTAMPAMIVWKLQIA